MINCANPPDSPSHANAPLPSRPPSSVPSTGSVDCILMQEMKETPSPRNKGNSSFHLVEHLKDVKSSNSLTPVAYQMRHVGRSFQCVPLERLQRINQSTALSVSTWSQDSKHSCFYLVQFSLVLPCWLAWCGLLESSRKWCEPSMTNPLISSVILFAAVPLVGIQREWGKWGTW